jgi:M6 family metalloprotease-like protein
MSSSRWLAIALAIASFSPGVSAQDVEMLGQRYGTRPPAGYYRELARDPQAFRFTRGRAARMREAMERQAVDARRSPGGSGAPAAGASGPAGAGSAGGPALSLGPRTGAVVGNVYIPVVLGRFAESPAPAYDPATIQGAYFGTQPGSATVATYYAEVSSDSISLDGNVRPWVQSTRSEAQTTQGESGLICCGIGDYIKDILSMQGSVDWGLFDNDGPDGVPNSGDDDGFVDALAVMHPSRGAECDGSDNRIWSHKWSLSDASSGHSPYTTSTPAANGGFIRIDDYFVQGVLDCDNTSLNPIGVFVHETGHAFGLPDLYDTRSSGYHGGAGYWDLMASGTYGCRGNNPARPCHMGAWSKAMLGWVDVVDLPPDTDLGTLVLPPAETTGMVYRFDAQDGSGEYFLLENRQDVTSRLFDKSLHSEGLLVWQVDWDVVLQRWASNTVNSNDHMGVWLRQADGRDDLGRSGGGRGDAGDPFPGSTGNTEFHAGSDPAARSYQGTAVGLSLLDITRTGDDVVFRAVTGYTVLAVSPLDIQTTATEPLDVQLNAQNGEGPVTWTHVGGALPEGLALSPSGRLSGTALDLGTFPVGVDVVDSSGLSASATVTLQVASPSIPLGQLASTFLLGGPPLSASEVAFLDRQGNGNGAYDLGDFRAWVLANPSLPLSAELAVLVGR